MVGLALVLEFSTVSDINVGELRRIGRAAAGGDFMVAAATGFVSNTGVEHKDGAIDDGNGRCTSSECDGGFSGDAVVFDNTDGAAAGTFASRLSCPPRRIVAHALARMCFGTNVARPGFLSELESLLREGAETTFFASGLIGDWRFCGETTLFR